MALAKCSGRGRRRSLRDFPGCGVVKIERTTPGGNHRHKRKEQKMKTLKNLLVAAAAVVTLNATLSAQAAEPLLSPKAKALADSLRKVPAVASGVNLAIDRPIGNARAWELKRSFRTVPSTGRSIDLAHGPRPLLSPKDPRYEMALRELRQQQFQVAPLK